MGLLTPKARWAPPLLLFFSRFQAWCGAVRDTGVVPATGAVQDGPRKAVGATFATRQDVRAAKAWAQEQCVARASVVRWRSHTQGSRADRQLRRARAQQAFIEWRAALGRRCKARQLAEERLALCRTQWMRESRLRRVSRARAAQKLSARWVSGAGGQPHMRLAAQSVSEALSSLLAEIEGIWWLVTGLRRLGSEGEAIPATAARPGVQVQTCTFQQCDPSLSKSLKVKGR